MITLVIPVYNEASLISELFERSKNALSEITENFEIIFIDDGSTDSTLEKLISCNASDKRAKVLTLSRNFGHQAAYTAGLAHSKGEYIAMMDGDLQDPPELLKKMYEVITSSDVEVVYGKRTRRSERFVKRFLIRLFHKIFRRLSNLRNIEQVGNFSLMTRKALTAFLSLNEKNRYLPGLRSFIGFPQGYVEYDRPDRTEGEAKMSFSKLILLAFDAVFSFSNIPVKICLYSGLFGIVLIFLALLYILIGKVTGMAPIGWS
ncbi:MAG: glycosyltransferase family 2 protein, partial [Flavitalea sp.]